ncbi:retinol dehydrogenase 2-like [Acanthaster planci]|uniref:Retinol dehydrogenase 2-like n=1 Tax=Acanthaster planci TaxID=133434 RepID=A0A8B7YM31_ACAPL|nr:retinol dehydrogenase 2-like [Acanthaster planci]
MAVDKYTHFYAWTILSLAALAVYWAEDSVAAKFIAGVLALAGLYIGSKLMPRGRVHPEGKVVFITGCDTGFGNGLARRLDGCGFTVYAGCYTPDGPGAQRLVRESSGRLTIVPCDVTSGESVAAARDTVKAGLQRQGSVSTFVFILSELFAVVNNAGIWRWGPVEWTPVKQYKEVAEVNVYGMIRVTQAFLPLIRKAKGRFVNVSSVNGLWTGPCVSSYHMTKYAVESFTDALRREMNPWGVKVVLIEPGEYGKLTNIALHSRESLLAISNPLWDGASADVQRDYGRGYFEGYVARLHQAREDCWDDVTPVLDAMLDAVASRRPKHRYIIGELSTYCTVYKFILLPSWLTDGTFYKQDTLYPKPAACREKQD